MSESAKHSSDAQPASGKLEFPVDKEFRDRPPRGSVEDGVRLSMAALEQVRERNNVFEERDQRRCGVEFRL